VDGAQGEDNKNDDSGAIDYGNSSIYIRIRTQYVFNHDILGGCAAAMPHVYAVD